MGFWGSIKNFGESFAKTSEALGQGYYAPFGLVFDLGRAVASDSFDRGDVVDNLSERVGGFADILMSDAKLTGAAISAVGEASYKGYTAATRPVEALNLVGASALQNDLGDVFSGGTWKRAWTRSGEGNLTQASSLLQGAAVERAGGNDSTFGVAVAKTLNRFNPASQLSNAALLAKDSAPIIGREFGFAPDGGRNAKDFAEIGQTLAGIGAGGLVGTADLGNIDPLAADAWQQYAAQSPLFASAQDMTGELLNSFLLDPAFAVGKAAKVAKIAASIRPISQSDRDAGILNVIESEASKYSLAKAGLKTRVGQFNGTVTEEAFTPGLVDKVAFGSELYRALPQLKENVFGQQIASMFFDTRRIGASGKAEDLQKMVNTRNTLYAAVYGDPTAFAKLRLLDEGLADQASNMVTGRVIGSADGQLVDMALADDIVAGRAARFEDRPETMIEAQRQLFNQPETVELLRGGLMADRERTLGVTAAGMRSLARERGQGIGRDLTMHTGFARADDAVNKVLEPVGRAASTLLQTKPGTIPVRLYDTNVGQMTAALVELPWRASTELRTRVARGNIALDDKNLVYELADGWLKSYYVDPATRSAAMGDLMLASDAVSRQGELVKIQGIVQHAMGREHGHSEEFTNAMIERTAGELNLATTQLNEGSRFASTLSERLGPDGQRLPVDVVIDNGVMLVVPVSEADNVNRMPIPDFVSLDRMFKREGGFVGKRTKDWHTDTSATAPLKAMAATGGKVAGVVRDKSLDVADEYMSLWKIGVLLRPAYGFRNTTEEVARHWAQGYAGTTAQIIANETLPAWVKGSKDATVAWRAAKTEHRTLSDLIGNNEKDFKGALDELAGITQGRTALAASHDALKSSRRAVESDPSTQAAFDATYNASRKAKAQYETDSAGQVEALQALVGDHTDMVAGRDALDVMLKSSAFRAALGKAPKGFRPSSTLGAGSVKVGNTNAVDDAFQGVHGEVAKALIDAPGGGMLDTDFAQSASRVLARSKQNTLFVSIDARNPRHLDHWVVNINHQIRNSALMREALAGKTPQEMATWLAESKTGKRILRETPSRRGDPEGWAKDAWLAVHDYVPTAALREKALTRPITKADLDRGVHVSDRPAVHGQELAEATGKGSGVVNLANAAVANAFHYVGDAPMQHLSRHPLYMAYYRDAVADMGDNYLRLGQAEGSTFDVVRGIQPKPRANASAKQVAKLEDQADLAGYEAETKVLYDRKDVVLSVDDLNAIQWKAHRMARERMSHTVYNMASRSNAAEFLRFVAPFMAAHQDSVTFWSKAISNDPAVATRIMQAFDAPRKLGLVVDGNGDPVPPGSAIQDDHYILWQVPKAYGGKDPRNNKQAGLRVSESSGLLMLQGGGLLNPGFGPLVQTPVAFLQTRLAGTESFDKVGKAINPWGAPQRWYDPQMSSTMKRIESAVGASLGRETPEYTNMLTMRARDLMVDYQKKHDGQAPGPAQQKKILQEAEHQTKQMAFMRVLYSSTAPMSVSPQSKYQFFIGEYRRLQKESAKRGEDFDWADQRFMDLHGDTYFPLTRSASANRGALDQTSGTMRELTANKSLARRVDPKLWRMIVGSEGAGEFSGDARRALQKFKIAPGSDETAINQKNPDDILSDQAASQGWERWGQANDYFNAEAARRGLTSYRDAPDLVAARRMVKDELSNTNQSWAEQYGSAGRGDFEVLVDQMREVATDPKLVKDPSRSDIRTLGMYLEGRDWFKAELQRRTAAGGNVTMAAQSNGDLQIAYNMMMSYLIESNTSFSRNFYDTVLDRDPFLNPDDIEAGGTP